ncbi:MAG: hypothetical protein WBA93_21705 [Microcoleaceae cyanobacterium]
MSEYPAGNGESTVSFMKELIKINQKEAKKNNEEERQILIIWDGEPITKEKKCVNSWAV